VSTTLVLHAADEAGTRAIAGHLARALAAAVARGAPPTVVLGLHGELGAGKTAFTRGFMAGLDPAREDDVASPTYAIVQLYAGDPPVRHLDLYRLASEADLEAIGWRDLYFSPGITVVEWIDRVPAAIPPDTLHVHLEPLPRPGAAPADVLDEPRRVSLRTDDASLGAILDGLSATVLAAFA
jgi:tRNA threonylcarbamoyladenosine biosynthesis protein TsaE